MAIAACLGVLLAMGNREAASVGATDPDASDTILPPAGALGSATSSFFAYGTSFTGGVRVATGDVNGDGFADIITGAGPGAGPHVKVFSGKTQAELKSFFAYDPGFTGGISVAAGDVNGDGIADIITGLGFGATPHVKVFDGVTGSELRSFFAYPVAFAGGVRVAAGDVNGDGIADIITGAGPGGQGHVRVFNGATGAELRSFFAYPSGFAGGVFVAAGDVNGDGNADIVTGTSPSDATAGVGATGTGVAPHVKVFSGATGAELASFFAYTPSFTGGVFVAAGDLNGDGKADLVVGPASGAQSVRVLNGAGLGELRSLVAYEAAFAGGVSVAVGDVNGDGAVDVVTAPGAGRQGLVKAYAGLGLGPTRTPTSVTASPTPTRTPTRTQASLTPTRTGTPTPSQVPGQTPSLTPTRTPTLRPIGGSGLTLRTGATGATSSGVGDQGAGFPTVLNWARGLQQTGYLVIRWSPTGGFAFLPRFDRFLDGTSTTFTDATTRPDPPYCYVLLVLGGQPTSLDHALGFSDFLCVYPGTREGASPPTNFAVRLDESNVVKLSWDSLGGQASYTLVATRFDTSLTRSIPLTANQTSYEEDTLGRTTCYRLTARTVVAELGRADTVCAAPGIANLGSTGDLRDLGAALDQLRSSP